MGEVSTVKQENPDALVLEEQYVTFFLIITKHFKKLKAIPDNVESLKNLWYKPD